MSAPRRVVIFGSTGFIGTEVARALQARGAVVDPLTTPRPAFPDAGDPAAALLGVTEAVNALAARLSGTDCVVNAAGVAEAGGHDERTLRAANGLVPGFLAMAAATAGVPRFVQVSSAAVQGRIGVLDASPSVAPFTPYSRSKALGEHLVRSNHPGAVTYRPPGAHGPDRHVSRVTARIARSRLSSVARPGSSPTPQALLANVADAVAFLATTKRQPPPIVAHPAEGLTTAGLLTLLGGHEPLEIPRVLARAVVMVLTGAGALTPAMAANARRLEMLWFGQSQAPSWLTEVGWSPPARQDAWRELGRILTESPGDSKQRPMIPATRRHTS